jgi:hypothetical protein
MQTIGMGNVPDGKVITFEVMAFFACDKNS